MEVFEAIKKQLNKGSVSSPLEETFVGSIDREGPAAFTRGGIDLSQHDIDIKVKDQKVYVPYSGIEFDVKDFQGFSFKIIKIEKPQKIGTIVNI